MSPENEYEVGDLIIFLNNNVLTMNNKVGIIIGTQVMTVFQEESLNKTRWYIALFGAMKLIVSEEMIQKLEFPT